VGFIGIEESMNIKYVAFLRAINVGGNRVVKMDALRGLFESLGFTDVATYIQSGNVIFASSEADSSTLEKWIQSQIAQSLGFEVETFLRTMSEVATIVDNCPFEENIGETVFIPLLHLAPEPEAQSALLALSTKTDSFAVQGREAYWLRRDRDKSPFSNNQIEKTLGTSVTTRNLNTLKKILEKYK
jgi:uncharacterized protein (DUF1697 family)